MISMYINSQLLITFLLKKTWRRHVHYNFRLNTYLSFDIRIYWIFVVPLSFAYHLFIKSKLTDIFLLLFLIVLVSSNLNENKVGLKTLDKIRLDERQIEKGHWLINIFSSCAFLFLFFFIGKIYIRLDSCTFMYECMFISRTKIIERKWKNKWLKLLTVLIHIYVHRLLSTEIPSPVKW